MLTLNEARKIAGLSAKPVMEAEEKSVKVSAVLNMLNRQKFADWYEKDFADYIEGAEGAKSKADILDDLSKML